MTASVSRLPGSVCLSDKYWAVQPPPPHPHPRQQQHRANLEIQITGEARGDTRHRPDSAQPQVRT